VRNELHTSATSLPEQRPQYIINCSLEWPKNGSGRDTEEKTFILGVESNPDSPFPLPVADRAKKEILIKVLRVICNYK
jgi:hypothetical protein